MELRHIWHLIMRNLIRMFFLSLTTLLAVSPVFAEDGRKAMTALIRAGDADAVLQALAVSDPAKEREAFGAFVTADPVVDRMSAALLAAHPQDPRAMVARGWYLLAAGWAVRGTADGRTITPMAGELLREMHGQGLDLAARAVRAAPQMVAASDLLLSLARTTRHLDIIPAEFDRIMAIHPTRQSLVLAALGYNPKWGGPAGWADDACDAWAAKVTDVANYTAGLCRLDMVYSAAGDYAAHQALAPELMASDAPMLDWARQKLALSAPLSEAELQVYRDVLTRMLKNQTISLVGAERLDELNGKTPPGKAGPATQKVLPRVLPELRDKADFNPGDSRALKAYVHALFADRTANGTPFPTDEVSRRYAMLFKLAPFDSNTWIQYAALRAGFVDTRTASLQEIDALRAYYINAVVAANQAPQALWELDMFNRGTWDSLDQRNLDSVDLTGAPAFDKAAFDALVVCPTVRTMRAMAAACAARPQAEGCSGAPMTAEMIWREYLERAKRRGACEAELTADPRDLAYTYIPVEWPKP